MDRSIVHTAHMAINLAHRFVYFVPEAAEEYAALGVMGRTGYFASRTAPMGPVADAVVLATFYNFHPRAVAAAMPGAWSTASPEALQAARFRAVERALARVGGALSAVDIAEARSIIDPVVAGLDLAGKPLAAANAAVSLPSDPMVALWQQITVIREWRGDVHIALLIANAVGPCECMILQVGTGRFPRGFAQASRMWNEQEWAGGVSALGERGWVDAEGAMTPAGLAAREQIEDDTSRLCEPIWQSVGDAAAARLAQLISPINAAMEAAGTYAALA